MTRQVTAEGLQQFQDAKFGMFIHWGPTAVLARHDAPMHAEQIPIPEYEKIAAQLNPTRFNADEWVSLAADAGQKYIVYVSRHHDGFSMYDTALTDYKITTVFGRDPVRELADACARRGDIKLGFYNSLLDWHHPAYRSASTWSEYVDFLHGQVRELCTNYGEIACMWFDGHWPDHKPNPIKDYFDPAGSFRYDELFDMIHTLQPNAVVVNNHGSEPNPGEDVQTFEQYLPGEEPPQNPREVNMTINNHWFYVAHSRDFKSTRHLIHNLVRSASAGANYLLNVGPTALGEIIPEHQERLRGIGEWLRANGESVYGTRGSTIEAIRAIFENPWFLLNSDPNTEAQKALKHWIRREPEVVATRKGDTYYIHVLDYISDWVTLQNPPENVTQAHLLRDGRPVKLERNLGYLALVLPEDTRDPFDTVVVLSP